MCIYINIQLYPCPYPNLFTFLYKFIYIGLWPLGSFSHHNDTSKQPWSTVTYLRPNVSTFEKRSVYGLILWVGSVDRIHLSHMQSNLLTLQNRTTNDSQKLFGWYVFIYTYTYVFVFVYIYVYICVCVCVCVCMYVCIYVYTFKSYAE
jgi:hypothetical protein